MFTGHLMLMRVLTLAALISLSSSLLANTAVPGGIYVWAIPQGATTVTYADQPVMKVAEHALIGLPITLAPGPQSLVYQQNGRTLRHHFEVFDKTYSEQHITLENKAMVNPPAETLARIRNESTRQRRLYESFSPPVDLRGGFEQPLTGVITSLFGHRRFFNGQARNPHSGLDIAADSGTTIHAAGNGSITLSDDLYFNGKTLFIDHGQGLVTMYCHMSELLVKSGETVNKGQAIGLVGATGRATGPHLHWSVSLNGTRVDPALFMQVLNTITSASGGE
ncbi:M23 family metallopeptidase [bacterium]|nr:M23 family metallopeptidase [bacterium]